MFGAKCGCLPAAQLSPQRVTFNHILSEGWNDWLCWPLP